MKRTLCRSLVLLTAAPLPALAEPPPLTVTATLADHAVSGHEYLLPSPGRPWLLLTPRCSRDHSTVRLLDMAAGAVRENSVAGRLQAAAWIDGERYVLVRAGAEGAALDLAVAPGAPQPLDALPRPPRLDEGADCGLRTLAYRLAVGAGPDGQVLLTLALRRDDLRFEIRRYALELAEGTARVVGRLTHETDLAAPPPNHTLWRAVPAAQGAQVALLWQNAPGALPRRRLELLDLGLGPVGLPTVRQLARASEDLEDCDFAGEGQLLCHHRAGPERGWLWLLGPGEELRQVTRAGQAAAYALSPDGASLAYIGSGGPDGPLVVRDLASGAERVLPLSTTRCDSAAALPEVHWLEGSRLLVRGHCAAALHIVATGAGAVPAAAATPPAPPPAEPPAAAPPPPAAAAAPAPAEAVRRPARTRERRHTRAQRAGAFWTPRY